MSNHRRRTDRPQNDVPWAVNPDILEHFVAGTSRQVIQEPG